jgi:hypothetical protein
MQAAETRIEYLSACTRIRLIVVVYICSERYQESASKEGTEAEHCSVPNPLQHRRFLYRRLDCYYHWLASYLQADVIDDWVACCTRGVPAVESSPS